MLKIVEINKLAKTIPQDEFLIKYNPNSCRIKFKDVKTTMQALIQKTGSLSQIKKGYGSEFQRTYLEGWIIDLQEKVGVKNKMHQEVIEELSEMIITDYFYLNLADINLIFTRAKKGFYGQFYENISMPKILEWFAIYANERADIAEQTNIDEDKVRAKALECDNLAKIEYRKELDKAHKTKDFTKVDNLLKNRTKPENSTVEQIKTLDKQINSLILFIENIQILIDACENQLLVEQYKREQELSEAQLLVLKNRKESLILKLNPIKKNKTLIK